MVEGVASQAFCIAIARAYTTSIHLKETQCTASAAMQRTHQWVAGSHFQFKSPCIKAEIASEGKRRLSSLCLTKIFVYAVNQCRYL